MSMSGLLSAARPSRTRTAFLVMLAYVALLLLAYGLRDAAWALLSLTPAAPFSGGCSASPVPC